MIRIEIVANHSVEENILEAMRNEGVGKYYTKYPGVYGVGSAGPRMGDAVWPEENFALVIWCEEEEARGIERAVAAVKAHFPDEGVKLFGLSQGRRAALAEEDRAWTPPSQAEFPPDAIPALRPLVQAPQTPVQAPQTLVQAPRTSALSGDGPEDPNAE